MIFLPRTGKAVSPGELYLVESAYRFKEKNFLTGRIELLDREELFDNEPEIKVDLARTAGTSFRIAAYTLGYTRDFDLIPRIQTGIGGNFTLYPVPAAIKPFYGDRPAGFILFMRFRIKGNTHLMQHGTQIPWRY